MTMEKLGTAGDVGLAINPALAEGQDIGAATTGMGIGMFEELEFDRNQLLNGNLLEYRLPRFSDMPRTVKLELVQNRDGVGPYGAKGGGEASLNSLPANIANAVYAATGAQGAPGAAHAGEGPGAPSARRAERTSHDAAQTLRHPPARRPERGRGDARPLR